MKNLTYKYNVLEYEIKSMTYDEKGMDIKYYKNLQQTNNKLIYYLIILLFKIKGSKYEVLK